MAAVQPIVGANSMCKARPIWQIWPARPKRLRGRGCLKLGKQGRCGWPARPDRLIGRGGPKLGAA
eukprot:scaffold51404_cov57-Phaeocystis_antarctica.AAC.2